MLSGFRFLVGRFGILMEVRGLPMVTTDLDTQSVSLTRKVGGSPEEPGLGPEVTAPPQCVRRALSSVAPGQMDWEERSLSVARVGQPGPYIGRHSACPVRTPCTWSHGAWGQAG